MGIMLSYCELMQVECTNQAPAHGRRSPTLAIVLMQTRAGPGRREHGSAGGWESEDSTPRGLRADAALSCKISSAPRTAGSPAGCLMSVSEPGSHKEALARPGVPSPAKARWRAVGTQLDAQREEAAPWALLFPLGGSGRGAGSSRALVQWPEGSWAGLVCGLHVAPATEVP